jgi:TM2 domain-containing membrane protein YozV
MIFDHLFSPMSNKLQHLQELQHELFGSLEGSELYTVHGLMANMTQIQKEEFLYAYQENRKKPLIATLLAVFGGIYGLHRFYLGQTGMGVAYFFTGGLLMVGWIRDMFRAGRMAREINQEIALKIAGQIGILSLGRNTQSNSPIQSPEHAALEVARKSKGIVTTPLMALESGLSIAEAEIILNELSIRGICRTELADDGRIEYHFRDFMAH